MRQGLALRSRALVVGGRPRGGRKGVGAARVRRGREDAGVVNIERGGWVRRQRCLASRKEGLLLQLLLLLHL